MTPAQLFARTLLVALAAAVLGLLLLHGDDRQPQDLPAGPEPVVTVWITPPPDPTPGPITVEAAR